jgi:hypothetical protein
MRHVADKLFFSKFFNTKNIFFYFQTYIFCQLIHALSPTLRKCAKFEIDWTGRSVLNIDYKICSRETKRQEVKLKRSVVINKII